MVKDDDNPASRDSPCGLYVHIPFCESKCGYCDFYSVPMGARDPGSLVDRVTRELGRRVAESPHKVRTVFCGGGTPTVLPTNRLADLLESVGQAVPSGDLAEFTIEANPATVDDDKAKLQATVDVIKTVPGDLSAVTEKATEIMGKIPDALTDLASQIAANPMAAKDLTDKQAQLEEGQTALERLATDAPALMDSATNLTATIMGLL